MPKQEVTDKKLVVKKILSCAGCTNTVSQPQTLYCYHSFCAKCVNKLQKKTIDEGFNGLICSVCRSFSSDMKTQSNALLNEFLEIFNISQKGETGVCEQCTKKKCTCKCVECKMTLCEECQESHARVPLLKNHRVIPLKADRDTLVIDRVIFCNIHDDEPVKLNCIDCTLPLCIKCKVTEHENHKTETVEKAIARISPMIESDCQQIEEKVKELSQMHADLLKKIDETKKIFYACRLEADQNLKQVTDDAKTQHKNLSEALLLKEEEEIAKLEIAKEKIEYKMKEYDNIQEWVNVTNRYAKGTSLLSEFETGLQSRVHDLSCNKFKLSAVIDHPKLEDNTQQKEMENMVGLVKYNKVVAVSSNVSSNGKHISVSLQEVFAKPLKVQKTVQLPHRCYRIAVINGEIWAPIPGQNLIQIYDVKGQLERSMSIQRQPRSVAQLSNGDVVVVGTPGLFVIDKDGKVTEEICANQNFTDLDITNDTISALNTSNSQYQEYTKSSGEWKMSKGFGLYRGVGNGSLISLDKAILTTANNNIQKYGMSTKSSQLLADLGVPYNFGNSTTNNPDYVSCAYVCCVDDRGTILVADFNNNRIQLFTGDEWKVV